MPSALPTPSARRDRVLPLDGLRTVAIAFVVLYHLHVPGFGSGFVGVNVFFVLSGYLITGLLISEHRKSGRIRLGRFWVRRLLRLYPTLLAVVVVGMALWWLIGDYQGSTMSALGAAGVALSYTGNIARSFFGESQGVFSPMWSLSMEEQFYLVWPPLLVLLLRARRRSPRDRLGARPPSSSAPSSRRASSSTPRPEARPPTSTSARSLNVAPLLLGCLLAVVLDSERGKALLRGRAGSAATWIGLAGVVGSLAVIGSGWQQQVTTFTVMLPGVAVASALLIGGLVSRPSWPARVLSLSPVAWFGRALSYPLYLWHVVFIALLEPVVPGALGKVAVIAAAVVTAWLSHRFVERPALRLKDKLESPKGETLVSTGESARESELSRA